MTTTDTTPSRLTLGFAAGTTVLVTLALLPVGGHQIGPSVSFMPAVISVVAAFDILSVYLLVGDYRDRGDVRLLLMAGAYAWSLMLMGGYALAFPGALMMDPPLALTPSMAPYLYLAWHGGFPIILGAAWAPWPSRWTGPTPRPRRARAALLVLSVSMLGGACGVAALALLADRLPVLIVGLDTTRMTSLTAPVLLPLVTSALVITSLRTVTRTGPERWTSVVVLVCTCDLVLTYSARSRFSLGWYTGRALTLVAAGLVLMAMLASFRSLKATAEQQSVLDALTGLQNRRGAYAAFDQMIAQSRRSGTPLAVVSFDLDWFKQVNDVHGHEAGDDVLAAVGRVVTSSCRVSDVVARVGGEEFLVVLHDTDAEGAATVAEKLRRAIAGLTLPSVSTTVTSSFGVAVLEPDDADGSAVLRRADAALYGAKTLGRNRVETCRSGASWELAQPPQAAAPAVLPHPSDASIRPEQSR